MVWDSNSGHQLLLPPANRCPIFASRTTQLSRLGDSEAAAGTSHCIRFPQLIRSSASCACWPGDDRKATAVSLAAKAVGTRGKGSVFATGAVGTRGKGRVFAAKAVGTRGKGSVAPLVISAKHRAATVCPTVAQQALRQRTEWQRRPQSPPRTRRERQTEGTTQDGAGYTAGGGGLEQVDGPGRVLLGVEAAEQVDRVGQALRQRAIRLSQRKHREMTNAATPMPRASCSRGGFWLKVVRLELVQHVLKDSSTPGKAGFLVLKQRLSSRKRAVWGSPARPLS